MRFKALPVILVTALETPEHRARGLEVGADGYLGKSSFEQQTLLDTIVQLLDESEDPMIRVVVADDSPTVRELLIGILESDPEIQVIGQAGNGVEAVDLAVRLRPDLVTMDIHMPIMDGLEATKEIMVRAPTPIVIVSSSTNGQEVDLSLHAMRAGALMAVTKLVDPRSAGFDRRRAELLAMTKAMAQVKVVRRWGPQGALGQPVRPGAGGPGAGVRLVAVAASTGGPAALHRILAALPGDFPVPILVVQHMAKGFVDGLRSWLASGCNLRVKVAEPGEPLLERTVFLAPDDRHLGVTADGRVTVVEAPPVNGFRPSGTYLFTSAAQAYGPAVTAVILTGMGNDGVEGLRSVRKGRGQVLAQDEATCVVYGMPREAIEAGLVDAVLPLDQIAARLAGITAMGGQPCPLP